MIVFVRTWDADARAVGARFRAEVEGPIARAQRTHRASALPRFRRHALSRRDVHAAPFLWPRDGLDRPAGHAVPPFTRFAGLYDARDGRGALRAAAKAGSPRNRQLDPQTIFDISTNNDIIGGNSGSPLLDREGHVVGAVFDGNIHSLGGDYFYDGTTNRAVTVSATAIRAALTQVYGMDGLVAELSGQ